MCTQSRFQEQNLHLRLCHAFGFGKDKLPHRRKPKSNPLLTECSDATKAEYRGRRSPGRGLRRDLWRAARRYRLWLIAVRETALVKVAPALPGSFFRHHALRTGGRAGLPIYLALCPWEPVAGWSGEHVVDAACPNLERRTRSTGVATPNKRA
eukprot:2934722-Pleurochrysis_carterae.AAC.2